MALNRDKLKNIVGGITTPAAPTSTPMLPESETATPRAMPPAIGQGGEPADEIGVAGEAKTGEHRRFAKRGRPKGRKDEAPGGKARKVKVSLFLREDIINDLYDWAHDDRIHPGEMFDRALQLFHEREAKRRNAGKE
jgi:hypothetical protein